MKITFDNIDIVGHVIAENELYKHYHYSEILIRYDSNFIGFKRMPTIDEFKEAEAYLREFHLKKAQDHVKFEFPPDQKLTDELYQYLQEQHYTVGTNELYSIKPQDFPELSINPDIQVEEVNSSTYKDYLTLQYEQDVQFGESYAEAKKILHHANFQSDRVVQIIAYDKDIPVGAVDVILQDLTAEMDNLFVQDSYQRKGIGSSIQRFVMDLFRDRIVILIADGEDTPREMYRKQNYHYEGFQIEVLKVYN
ncbi:GNAT family N-acetyltransferase [Ornithinibacillus massiliensis]|uniref:GNAT family N-acetyltransferase n=1 Tax=Ornithinibacillus massiliensis TaxID=1944633 RepID=A0ABS5MGV7_9BACI|nr:GNAT family N-acetyltransferase [Ornithinibacillus massiliensis]MBS3681337.1 GNAT family N-acetyltransferase [Ornithinibacillus massiliensis]